MHACFFLQPQCEWTSIYDLPRLPYCFMVRSIGKYIYLKCYTSISPFNVESFGHCFFFFFFCSVRVSNELGGGNAKAAKFSIKVIIMTSTFFGVLFFVLCLAFGRQLSYLFTTSEEIADAISELSVFLAFSLLLNSIQSVLSGKTY